MRGDLVAKAKNGWGDQRKNKLAYVFLYTKLEDMCFNINALPSHLGYIDATKYPPEKFGSALFQVSTPCCDWAK